jgi:hypothetical protein
MVALANGYFETIERNNGMIRTRFHPHCNRVENGVQTTNNTDFPLPIAGLGCEAQFALGWYRYDDDAARPPLPAGRRRARHRPRARLHRPFGAGSVSTS